MLKKLNVLITINHMESGGSQTHVSTLAEGLKAEGHELTVVSWGGSLVKKLEQLNINHYKLPFYNFFVLYSYLRTVKSRIKKPLYFVLSPFFIFIFAYCLLKTHEIAKKKRIDLIHSNQPIPTSICFFTSKLLKTPLVTTVHGLGLNEFPPYAYNLLEKRMNITGKIKRIISISEEVKRFIIHNYAIDQEKIVVIPNGINLEKFRPRTFINQTENKRVVLFVSGRSNFDAAYCLVQATPKILEEVPNSEIIIVGKLQGIDKIAEKMNEKFGKKVLVVLGKYSNDKLPELINRSTLVIGTGRSILEAMACRKAVIVAGTQGFGGIVTYKNIQKLQFYNFSGRGTNVKTTKENVAENVIILLKDDKLRESLELFSIKTATNFGLRDFARRTLEVYFDALKDVHN